MAILALILARGSSKSVPRKNIRDLAGRPLLSYALTEALKVFPKVFLSTEDSEIAEVGVRFGATVLSRPLKLASDESKSIDVVKYHLKELRVLESDFEAVLLLNSCTPFVKEQDFRTIVDMYNGNKCDSVVSLVEDSSAHPSKTCYLLGDKVYSLQTNYSFETGERQLQTKVYKRNTALYLSSVKTIKKGSFFGPDTRGYVMPAERSLDINSEWDLKLANLIQNEINLL